MPITLLRFGKITELFPEHETTLQHFPDTDTLRQHLEQNYPSLRDIPYLIAVDKNICTENTPIPDNCTVALLPPFSGG